MLRLPRDGRSSPRATGTGTGRPGTGLRWAATGLVIAWLVALAGLLTWGAVDKGAAGQPSAPSPCSPASPGPDQKPATLTPIGGATLRIPFGRDLGTKSRRIELRADDPTSVLSSAKCLEVATGQFISDSGEAELADERMSATLVRQGSRLVLTTAFDRTGDALGPAGTYTGVLSVVDPRVQRLDIPVTVTLEYPVWQFPLAVFVAILLPAILYVWLLRGSFTSGRAPSGTGAGGGTEGSGGTAGGGTEGGATGAGGGTLGLAEFKDYFLSRNGILAIATGSAAAFGIYTAIYLAGTSWQGDGAAFVALAGGMLTAFTTAGTTVSAAGVDKAARS